MTRRGRVWAWFTNWRNGATLAATLVAATVLFVVVDASQGRHDAFEALQRQTRQQGEAREAATRRIDLLQARIDELVGKGEANAQVLGQLVGEVEALRAQVRAMGGDPVVDDRTTFTSTTTRQPASPSTTPREPPTTTQPSPSPSPSPTSTTTTTTPRQPCLLDLPIVGCAAPNTARRNP